MKSILTLSAFAADNLLGRAIGVKKPFPDFIMKHQRYIVASLFAVLVILGITQTVVAAEEVPEKKDEPIGLFHIPKNGDLIVLPVTVGKQENLFWLDTGASVNAIDVSLINELGNHRRTVKVNSAKDIIIVESHEPPALRLGSVSLKTDGEIITSDLANIRKVTGHEIYGVLGMNSLKHFIVQIDFDNGELKLYPPETKAEIQWGEPFAISCNYQTYLGCPEIDIPFNDVSFSFMIDTGDSSISIDSHIFQWLYHKRQLCITGKSLMCTSFGQKSEKSTYMLNRFSLGSFEHNNVICDQGNGNRLGLSYLSRYRVTFDFPHDTMYLQKGKHFQDIEHDDMSGLHILREEKNTVVHSVDSGSQGEIGGIQSGDMLLRVDNQEASKIWMFDLRNIFKSGDGKKIRLTILRDGKEMEKSVVLKEKIPQWAEAVKE